MNEASIRVLLADDHLIVLAALRALLERHGYLIVGEAASGEEAILMAARYAPQVVIMDLEMPGLGGLASISRIRAVAPAAKILILSAHNEEFDVMTALSDEGADGYLVKIDTPGELINAIRATSDGKPYISSSVAPVLLRRANRSSRQNSGLHGRALTRREREVLRLVAQGISAKEIAQRLDISPKTAQVHSENIRQKLGVHSIAEMVHYAIKHGIIKLG